MLDLGLKYIYFFILPTFFAVYGVRLILGNRTLPQRILGIYFITFCLRNVAAYQLSEANSEYFIHFHYVQSPLHYLFGPLGYLFCLYALKPYRSFVWYDLFHFLPFLLHFLELTPFFFGPVENKYIDLNLSNKAGSYIFYPSLAGYLPIIYHAIFKTLISVCYLIFEISMWVRHSRTPKSIFYKNNNLLLRWIGLDLFFKLVSIVLILLQLFGKFNVHTIATFSPSDMLMFLGGVMNFMFFLISPKLLNGALFETLSPHYFGSQPVENLAEEKISGYGDVGKSKLFRDLQILMEVDAPYLDERFTIKILAQKLKISERNLSKVIKENLQMSFPDFVATYRLNYLKMMVKQQPGSGSYTIEKLAEISGFGSRQALYKVVQRLHHTTPNKYLEIN